MNVTVNWPSSEVTSEVTKPQAMSMGGGLEGADRISRETALWSAPIQSPDNIINGVKEQADARGHDSARNDGYIAGASQLHKDSIVGAQFRLNAEPKTELLASLTGKKFDDVWEEEFQQEVEARFAAYADSDSCWFDATRTNTFTGMMRLAIAVFLTTGESISTVEWVRESNRPYKTCIQDIRSSRLCNPLGQSDTRYLRRGVVKDDRGKALSYWIRKGERLDYYPDDYAFTWTNVAVEKPWGRAQVVHIIEQHDYGQSRGIADIVSVLKNIRMTKKFREIVLQNAVVNATYAAAIESELPSEVIVAALGNAPDPMLAMNQVYGGYMGALSSYLTGGKNIAVDGVKIPHLFPGTKMRLQNAGTPGGVGSSFEESLLRHTAAGLGVSYEGLSRDFSKTNYSSGRLAVGLQAAAMASRKKHVADRKAGIMYALLLEEMMGAGDVPLPRGVGRDVFYAPLAKEAFVNATWIGSGSGQIDELKETQAAMLRIRGGLTTHSQEGARLGLDWRQTARQRAREQRLFVALGVVPNYDALKPQDKLGTDAPADEPANANPGGNEE